MESITITYHTEAGEITGSLTASPDTIKPNKVGLWVYGSGDAESHYIKDGQITERPNQQTKLKGLMLTDLPAPCTIYINDQSYEGDSETAELEFDQPTTYEIKVESWPYIDWETTYENHS